MLDRPEYKTDVLKKGAFGQRAACRLQISMNNPKHTGPKLKALVGWAKANFNGVTVSLADTLYRHNLQAAGMEPRQANAAALRMGDAWIAENKATLDGVAVSRWDEWLAHPDYARTKVMVDRAISTDKSLSDLLGKMADAYASRQKTPFTATQHGAIRDYFAEELAVFALQHRAQEACDVYAGTPIPVFDYARSAANQNHLPEWQNIRFTKVDFVRR